MLNHIAHKHAIINCYVHHAPFFECYGFKPIDALGGYSVNGVNKVTLSLRSSISFVQKRIHEKLLAMTEEYQQVSKVEIAV